MRGILSSQRSICTFVITVLAVLLGGAGVATAATYEVNSVGDQPDANVGDGVCQTEEMTCTLRAAIQEANADSLHDVIEFDIGPTTTFHQIRVNSELPFVTESLTIDGNSQPNGGQPFPSVAIDGRNTTGAHGLTFFGDAADSEVRGLSVLKFERNGIVARSGVDGMTIRGNFVGTNKRGTTCDDGDSGMGLNGILLRSADNVVRGNLVSCNRSNGIRIIAGTLNDVRNNRVGTNRDGDPVLGNLGNGVRITSGVNNNIRSNTIAGNNGDGVKIDRDDSDNNAVRSSHIMSNGRAGVHIHEATNTLVRGNRIRNNQDDGVLVRDSDTGGGNVNTAIRNNYIGTDADGETAMGNAGHGVRIVHSTRSRIGGPDGRFRNVISANGGDGVHVAGSSSILTEVQANFIGTDKDGQTDLGNAGQGVRVSGANDCLIGGSIAMPEDAGTGPGNLIAFNNGHGVLLDHGADECVVEGNDISDNGKYGVRIFSADDNLVAMNYVRDNARAGLQLNRGAERNTIKMNEVDDNGHAGLQVIGANSVGNSILETTFSGNGRLGIDLGADGVTPNDYLDADNGPNNLQNFPKLKKAWVAHDKLFVKGKLHSEPEESYKLQFFANDACDASGYGEGETFLGSTTVTTDADGNTPFYFAVDADEVTGGQITATATQLDASDQPTDTSEFSKCKAIPLLKAKQGEDIKGKLDIEDEDAGPHTMMQFKLEALVDEDVSLETIKLKAGGSGDEKLHVKKVKLYKDWDKDGEPNGSPLAKGSYDSDNGYLKLDLYEPLTLEGLTSKTFVVTYKMTGEAFASSALELKTDDVAFASTGVSPDSKMPVPLAALVVVALGLPAFMLGRRRIKIVTVTLVAAVSLVALNGCVEEDAGEPGDAVQTHAGGPPFGGGGPPGGGGPAVYTYNVSLVEIGAKTEAGEWLSDKQIKGLPVDGRTLKIWRK